MSHWFLSNRLSNDARLRSIDLRLYTAQVKTSQSKSVLAALQRISKYESIGEPHLVSSDEKAQTFYLQLQVCFIKRI